MDTDYFPERVKAKVNESISKEVLMFKVVLGAQSKEEEKGRAEQIIKKYK